VKTPFPRPGRLCGSPAYSMRQVPSNGLGSANGTLVDGTEIGKLAPHKLAGGEILTMGRLMLYFLPPREFVEHVRGVAPPSDFGAGR